MPRDADPPQDHPASGLMLALLMSMGLWVSLALLARRFIG
jgi:hypothetical protein